MKRIYGQHADQTFGKLEFEHVPFHVVAIDDAGSLRVASDWLLERGHEHLPKYLTATADLWDAGCGTTLADLAAAFEEWRTGRPSVPQPAVWCRYGLDKWSTSHLERMGRVNIRCRRERRAIGSGGTACTRAWWDVHRRTGNERPVVELHQYNVRANAEFARFLRRRANR